MMFEVHKYIIKSCKNQIGFRVTNKSLVAKFDDLAAAHNFASGKRRHVVQYSKKAIKEATV